MCFEIHRWNTPWKFQMFPARNVRKIVLGSTILWSSNILCPFTAWQAYHMQLSDIHAQPICYSAQKALTTWVFKGLMTQLYKVPIVFWQMQDGFRQGCETPFKWFYPGGTLATLHSLEQTFAQMNTYTYARLSCHRFSQPSSAWLQQTGWMQKSSWRSSENTSLASRWDPQASC